MSTSPAQKPFAFVIMPFDKGLDPLFEVIRQAAEDAGVYAERVDGQVFDRKIIDQIHNQLNKADFVIAVVSGQNPNVMYEVGYAVAVGTPLIPVIKAGEKIPFDINQLPHVMYDAVSDIGPALRKRLVGHLKIREEGAQRRKVQQREFAVQGVVLSEEHGVDVRGYWVPANSASKTGHIRVMSGFVGFALTIRNPAEYAGGREHVAFVALPTGEPDRRVEVRLTDARMQRVAHEDELDEVVMPLEMDTLPYLPTQIRVQVGPGWGSGVYRQVETLGLHVAVLHYTPWGKRIFQLLVKPSGFIDDGQNYIWEG